MLVTRPVVAVVTAPGEGWPPGLEPLAQEAVLRHADSTSTLSMVIPEADVLLVTDFRTSRLREVWPMAHRLRWIHAASAGVDALLFPALIESPIPVTNARGIFDGAIAEYVLGLVLAFAKDLAGTLEHQRKHRWHHRESQAVAGRRLLVVGAGAIGLRIARLARAVGMRAVGVARDARPGDADFETVHGREALHRLLPEADYVVIAAPLTRTTRGLFDDEAFAVMKPGAHLINIGRGAIVQTNALVAALEAGRLAGAALDVFEQEPLPEAHPLWSMPGVIVSPHMAGDFIGWREALGAQFVENFRRWRKGEPLLNVVEKAHYR